MAISPEPYALQNASHSAALFRQAVSSLVPPGGGVITPGDLAVTQTTVASMQVQVAVGRVWIPGTEVANISGANFSTQAMYYAENESIVTLPIDPADATNPRIDVAYVSVNDQAYSGTLNQANIAIAKGTPNATPVAPTVPNNALALANIAVAANASSIITANITTPTPLHVVGPGQYINLGMPTLSGWTLTGSWYALRFGDRTLLTVSMIVLRTGADKSFPGGAVPYTDIGVIAPAAAMAGSGSPAQNICWDGFNAGIASYADFQFVYIPATGHLQARGGGGSTSIFANGTQTNFQLTYLI